MDMAKPRLLDEVKAVLPFLSGFAGKPTIISVVNIKYGICARNCLTIAANSPVLQRRAILGAVSEPLSRADVNGRDRVPDTSKKSSGNSHGSSEPSLSFIPIAFDQIRHIVAQIVFITRRMPRPSE